MRPGDVAAERFTIEAPAGSGGVGAVYRARDRVTGRRVALKVLHDALGPEVARFADEARVLAEIDHPAIVGYVAHGTVGEGVAPHTQYLAMEWLDGEDLACRLAREGMSVADAVTLARALAEALGVLHRRGLVHRDIKPSNIFLVGGRVDEPKLLDFGLVRLRAASQTRTRTGTIVGTPAYMAPEQARGERHLDARADVFSLGAVLFECLTGQPAFAADQLLAVLARILLDDAPRIVTIRPDLPADLDDLVAAMLARAKDARPADGDAVAALLAGLAGVAGAAPRPIAPAAAALSLGEQRLVSVVWVAGECAEPPPFAETRRIADSLAEDDPILAALRPHGLVPERLADGSHVVLLSGSGTALDLAARAARCALVLQGVAAGAGIVVATGRGDLSSRLAVGEVLERTVALLDTRGGSIRLDDVTAALLGARFDVVRDARGFVLRGEGGARDPGRVLLGRATPCVGRERELRLLASILDESVEETAARAVLVTGAPGAGKSRLCQEWIHQVAARAIPPARMIASGDPVRAGSPFGLAGQLVRDAAGLAPADPPAVRRDKLAAFVAPRVPAADAARITAFLGEITAAPFPDDDLLPLRLARQDPVAMGDQIRTAFEALLVGAAARGPILIVADDLQWADLPSVRLLDHVLRRAAELPLAVAAFARPDVDETFPNLFRDRPLTAIRMGPLPRRAAESLVRDALGETTPDPVVARLVDHAAGNPFFLEELIRATAEGRGDALPGTVLAMVQSRIEAIDPDARLVLRAGSIFGQTFWKRGALALLGGAPRTGRFGDRFEDLIRRELLEPSPASRFPDHAELVFRHATVREAAYAMLTDADRTLGHRLAAEWLEAAGETDALVLAEHHDRGGDPARAVHWYCRAAKDALEGHDLAAVLDRAQRGIACGASGEVLGELHMLASEAYFWRGQPQECDRESQAARALLPRGGLLWCKCQAGRVLANVQLNNLGGVLDAVEELRDLDPTPEGAPAYLMSCAVVVSFLINLSVMDVLDVFRARIARAAALIPAGDPAAFAWTCHAELHVRGFLHGDAFAYLTLAEQAALAFERAGDLRTLAFIHTQIGAAATLLGLWDRAHAAIDRARDAAERLGVSYVRLRADLCRAELLVAQGRAAEAIAIAHDVEAAFHAGGVRSLGAVTRLALSRAHLLAGDLAAAEREASLAVSVVGIVPLYAAVAHATLSGALCAAGRAEEALNAAEAAIGWTSNDLPTAWEAVTRLAHAEALHAAGKRDRALAAIRTAQDRLLARAATIPDEAMRQSFLRNVRENARTLALANEWLTPEAPPDPSESPT